MGIVSFSSPVSVKSLFDISKLEKLPESFERVKQSWEQHLQLPTKPDNHPDYVHSQVVINGEVVATLYMSGGAEMSNAAHSKVKNLPSMGEGEMLTGLPLAEKRAEEIAAALGGKVVKIATNESIHSWETRSTSGTQADTLAAQLASGRTYYHAQVLGQGDPMAQDLLLDRSEHQAAGMAKEEPKNDATEAFLEFVNMSFEERMLFQILGEEGMTKEEFEALSPEDQEKIMAKVRERLALRTQPDGTAPVKDLTQDLYSLS